jgi:hypothetical protein
MNRVAEDDRKTQTGELYEIRSFDCQPGSGFRCVAPKRADKRLLLLQRQKVQHQLQKIAA